MALDLLLTDEATLARVLDTVSDAGLARAPEPEHRAPSELSLPGHSDDLRAERWGVIVPDTAAGAERLGWLRPLCELRSRQCGLGSVDELPVLRVAPGMTRAQARSWRADYERRHPAARPGYLVIAGDLDEVPLELQQELGVSASVGRLCFTTLDGQPDRAGYQAYCEKLVAIEAERKRWDDDPQMLFYASHDGRNATATGYQDLVRRAYGDACAEHQLRLAAAPRLFGSADDHEWYAPGASAEAQGRTLLDAAVARPPAVLLSLTHGLGVTERGRQRLRQGALVIGEATGKRRTEVLDHAFFQQTFLPRGFWFLKACFGGGTPSRSVYDHWLAVLGELDQHSTDPRDALVYLAADDAPFVARVPQVALARGDGPLGILAHVDLDWTYGIESLDEAAPAEVHGEHGPYYDVLRMVAAGHRFGPAVAGLTDKVLALGSYLAVLYGDAEISGIVDDGERRRRRAWTWMRYLDLAGYILLGDPAAQLPVAAARDQARPDTDGVTASLAPTPEQMERAVLEYLRLRTPPEQIARDAGVPVAIIERWVSAYKDAGQRALRELATGGGGSGQ
jgi:hypothetical protein